MSDAISTDSGFDPATDSVIERIGVDPGEAFGNSPIDRAVDRTNERDIAGYGREFGDFSADVGEFGARPDPGLGGNDRYERNLDGSVKLNRDGTPRRKRGRPKGYTLSGAGSSAKASSDDVLSVSAISSVIIMVAGTAAAMTNHDHWATDEAEVKPLAEATAELEKHYNIPLTPKQLALFNFTLAAGMFIAPRVVLSAQRVKSENANKAKKSVAQKTQTPSQPLAPVPEPYQPVMRNPGFDA